MKYSLPLILLTVVFLSACASPPKTKVTTTYHYLCESGETIKVHYPTLDQATLVYKQNTYQMKIAIAASGARYLGEQLEWWTKGVTLGAEGTLLQHKKQEGSEGKIIEFCKKT